MVTFPAFPNTGFSMGTLKSYFALGTSYQKFLDQFDNLIVRNPRANVGDPDAAYYYDILSSPQLSSGTTASDLITAGYPNYIHHHYDLDSALRANYYQNYLNSTPPNLPSVKPTSAMSRPLVYDPLFEDSNNHYFEGTKWTHVQTGTADTGGLRMNGGGTTGGPSRVVIRLNDGVECFDEDVYIIQVEAYSTSTTAVNLNFGFTHGVYDNNFPLSSSYWYNPTLTTNDPWVAESVYGTLYISTSASARTFHTNRWTLEDGSKYSFATFPDYGNQFHSHLVLWVDSGPGIDIVLNRVQIYKVYQGRTYDQDEAILYHPFGWDGTTTQSASQFYLAGDIDRNNPANTILNSDKTTFQNYIENRGVVTDDQKRHIDNTILSHFWGPLDLLQTYAKGGGVVPSSVTTGTVPNAPIDIISQLGDIATGTADASSFRTKVWLRNRAFNDSIRGREGGGSLLDYYKQKLYADEGDIRSDKIAAMNTNSTLDNASAASLKKLSDGDISGYFADVGTSVATTDGAEIRDQLTNTSFGTWLDIDYNEHTTTNSGGGNPAYSVTATSWDLQCGSDAGGGSNPFSVSSVDVQLGSITINGVLPTTNLTVNNWYAVDLYLNSNTGAKTINDSIIGTFFAKLTTFTSTQHVWTLQSYPSKQQTAIATTRSIGPFSVATCSRDTVSYSLTYTNVQSPMPVNTTISNTWRWNDWGGDIFDGWGSFYLYDGTTAIALAPNQSANYTYLNLIADINAAAENNYYKFQIDLNSETYEVTWAWRDSGTFFMQVFCISTPTKAFYVGGGGNMGSDSSTNSNTLSYVANITGVGTRTIEYIENFQTSSTTEKFYVHGFPMNDVGATWGLNRYLSPNDNLYFWTGLWQGCTLYFHKQYDPIINTAADIAAGQQVAGAEGFPGELRDVYGPLADKSYGTTSNLDLYTYNVTRKDRELIMPGCRYGDFDCDGVITSNDVEFARAMLKGKKMPLALTRTGVMHYPWVKPQTKMSAVLTGHHKEGTFLGGSVSLPHNRHGNPSISMGDFRGVELPEGMGDAAVADINTAMSGYVEGTLPSTVVTALSNLGYTTIAIPTYNACAELLVGVSPGPLTAAGRFNIDAFNTTTPIARTVSFNTTALNGFPYIGFVGFANSAFWGCGIMVYSDYSTLGTLLKDLWYPNQYRTTFGHVRDANGTIYENTSTATRTIYSDGQGPGVNGYYATNRFSVDDGTWGISFNAGLDGNGGPYLSQFATDRWGCENPNGGDSAAANFYWGSTTVSTQQYKFYFFVGY